MRAGAIVGATLAALVLGAVPAFAATPSYEYGGKTYYLVDGNNPSLNSGDRVCQSMGLKCTGYIAHTGGICKHFHPNAATNYGTVNGSSAEFYCDSKARHDIACDNNANTCLTCAACGVNATCSDQVDYHFAEMYVLCASTSTSPAATSSAPAATSTTPTAYMSFSDMFRAFWQNIFAHAWWYHAAPGNQSTQTGAQVKTSPMVGQQGAKLPGAVCAHGGECKSGNCVRDNGVYRCSCSPIGNDYSSCH